MLELISDISVANICLIAIAFLREVYQKYFLTTTTTLQAIKISREHTALASRKFPTICQHFNCRWNPTEAREEYLTTFSVTAWKKLSPEEKQQHALQSAKHAKPSFKY